MNIEAKMMRESIDRLERRVEKLERLCPSDATPCSAWLPVETAPKDSDVFFWVVPKVDGDEGVFADTSGKPILSKGDGHRVEGKWGQWGCLYKPTHWMPLPLPPNV